MRRQGQNLLGPRPRHGRRIGKWLLLFLAGTVVVAAIPHLLAWRLPRPVLTPADAILVFAGGENRVRLGYRAWTEGRGSHLFLLGAGKSSTLSAVLPGSESLPPEEASRLHIEGWSENTLENAVSAKQIVSRHGFRSVILVTSDYHLARAHLALRTVLPPEVRIYALPVRTEGGGASLPRQARLYFREGWKYWGYRMFLFRE